MRNTGLAILFFIALGIVFSACSSAPKNPSDIFELRRRAELLLDQGNRQADRGSPGAALLLLDEAMQIAIAADDPGLRIRVGLSRGNVLFSLGLREESGDGWLEALTEAERIGNGELTAVSRIHFAWGRLLSSAGQADTAQSVRDDVNRDLAMVKSERLYIAFAWTVIGLAEKELGNYSGAEAAVRRSLEIHEKDVYLELAAYNWFLIASFRSLSGDFMGARQALESALTFDRRVENSWGLACDWRAFGDVYKKEGNMEAAHTAYLRAAEIFRAMGNEEAAEEALSRIDKGSTD
jgi:tetratricopeptide (TPR) repeat protein